MSDFSQAHTGVRTHPWLPSHQTMTRFPLSSHVLAFGGVSCKQHSFVFVPLTTFVLKQERTLSLNVCVSGSGLTPSSLCVLKLQHSFSAHCSRLRSSHADSGSSVSYASLPSCSTIRDMFFLSWLVLRCAHRGDSCPGLASLPASSSYGRMSSLDAEF